MSGWNGWSVVKSFLAITGAVTAAHAQMAGSDLRDVPLKNQVISQQINTPG